MRKKGFTLVELLIVVVVIGILATIAIPAYRNFKEDANSKVCETNLKALQAGYNICIMEKGVVPACLSEIPDAVLEKAFADLLKEKGGWKIRLAYFVVDMENRGLAYAANAPFHDTVARGNLRLISCPSDPDSPAKTGDPTKISYGYNKILYDPGTKVGITKEQFQDLPSSLVLIGDKKTEFFTSPDELEQRHKTYGLPTVSPATYAKGVGKKAEMQKITNNQSNKECHRKLQYCCEQKKNGITLGPECESLLETGCGNKNN